ncbi:unnamed protein product [Plutella xylostella]|uniref:(diamondback moth) hypothetical protein n=1 Tax=Plutella xylostella TaxID=51655 RepID=A0A8S4EJR5_PLUXY|nr:unnamed protein product [Plutella xylostella]
MQLYTLLTLAYAVVTVSGWSYYPVRGPIRITRFARPPPYRIPVYHHRPAHHPHLAPVAETEEVEPEVWQQREKRNHHDDYDSDHHDYDHHSDHDDKGVTGPVHTFVKTDKNANYKWGVRHHVGNKFAS